MLADSVGLALLVVLERLNPAERLAFVLHDLFAVPFDEIGGILDRSPGSARQLASRARRRVQGISEPRRADISQQKELVTSFLRALRARDFAGLIAVLDPDVVVRIDETAAGSGGPREIRGAENWAKGALAFSQMIRSVQPALVDGSVGVLLAPRGRLLRALRVTIAHGKIGQVEIIADPARLAALDIAVLSSK